MKKKPFLSVVVPAYNEEHRLRDSLVQIRSYLENRALRFEILVVNDGSTDRTGEIAERCVYENEISKLRVLHEDANRGKGYCVRRGMLEVTGKLALLTDADLSTPVEEMPVLENKVLDEGCAIAFGSRDLAESQIEIHQPWYRERGGQLFNRLVRIVTGLPYRDTQCGFKLFNMMACRAIFEKQRIDRYAFDVEILFIAERWGLKACEVPVHWRHAVGSKIRLIPDAPMTALDLLRIRWFHLTGAYRRQPAMPEGSGTISGH